jgi:hypothetical protein
MTQKVLSLKVLLTQITEVQLESTLQTLDRLHDAATVGNLQNVCMVGAPALIGWLEDIIYTAQETIAELHGDCQEQEVEVEEKSHTAVVRLYRQG